jgi:hypothetical protein
LHLDTDVIIDRPIDNILQRIALQPAASFTSEGEFFHHLTTGPAANINDPQNNGQWFGLRFLKADPQTAMKVCPVANAGIVGYRDITVLQEVRDAIRTVGESPIYQDIFKANGDQPFFNYIAVKFGLANDIAMKGQISLLRNTIPERPLGMAHFLWCVGMDKPRMMRQYLDALVRLYH